MASRTGRKQFTDKESSFSFSSNSNHYSPRPMFNRSRHMNSRVSLDAKRHRTLRTIFFLILLGGVSMLFLQNSHVANSYKTTSRLRKGSFLSPQQELDQFPSFNQDEAAIASDHLIIVAGHSVITSTFLSAERGYNNARDWFSSEDAWFLLDYQKKQGLPNAILGHIETGIRLAQADRKSLLVFSGGETRSSMGPITEGASYFRVADAMNLWEGENVDVSNNVRARTVAEEFATDSYENLIFSICRFYEITGSYPRKITMVSFSFKEKRFKQMHASAIRWPKDQFFFVGYDPPASTGFDFLRSSTGELQNAAIPFESDPYGCSSDVLKTKRQVRNPFNRTPPYQLSCPAMKDLLRWCGPETYQHDLPWSKWVKV